MKDYNPIHGVRETLSVYGPSHLNDMELAILLGVKPDLRSLIYSLPSNLRPEEVVYFAAEKGYKATKRQAEKIAAILELTGRRKAKNRLQQTSQKISQSRHAYEHFSWMASLENEEMHVATINSQMRVITTRQVGLGGTDTTYADIRDILQMAIMDKACGVVICHNHPSGSIEPSQADINLTCKMKAACETMNLKMFDHVIVAGECYFSFADDGRLG